MLYRDDISSDYQNGMLLQISDNSGVRSSITPAPKPFSVVSLLNGIKKDAVQLSQGFPLTTSATGYQVNEQKSSFGSQVSKLVKNSGLFGLIDKTKSEFNNQGILPKKTIEFNTEPNKSNQETDLMPYYIGGGIAVFAVFILIIVSIARR